MTSIIHTHNAGIDSYLFKNGFKLILAHYPGAPKARVELVVRVGSKHEGYGETGMAHLLEHMLFKSTAVSEDMKVSLTKLSIEWNGTTSADSTNYYELVSPDNVLNAIDLEFNRLFNATFNEEHLRTEMTVVRNEMDRAVSGTSTVMINTMKRMCFDWHGYGRTTLGSPSDVEGAPFSALRSFYKKHYRVGNAFLLVTGNFDKEAVLADVQQRFGELTDNGIDSFATANWTVEGGHYGGAQRDVYMPMNKNQAWLGWRMPPMFSRESVALQLAMNTLGSDTRGALRQELVIDEKKLVDLQSACYDLIDGGIFLLMADGHSNENPQVLATLTSERLYRHLEMGISEADLEDSRQDELGQYHEVLNNWELLQHALVDAELQGDWQWAFLRKDFVEDVTYEEMVTAARKWIVPHSQCTVRLYNGTPECPPLFKVGVRESFKQYDSIMSDTDAVASSYIDLHAQPLVLSSDESLRVVLMPRKTQSGYAYIEFDNIVGDDLSRAPHAPTAMHAHNFREFGGNGYNQKKWDAWLNAQKAEVDFRPGGFSLKVPANTAFNVLENVLRVYHAPQMSDDEFQSVKEQKLAALHSALASHKALLFNWLAQQWNVESHGHWARTPTLQESMKSLEELEYNEAVASLAWMSQRGKVRLSVVGDFSQSDLVAIANKYALDYPSETSLNHKPIVRTHYDADLTAKEVHTFERGDAPNALVVAIGPLRLNAFHNDAQALSMAVHAFGGDTVSRLWNRIREQGGLAYQVGASLNLTSISMRSNMQMVSSCAVEQMLGVQEAMREEWERFIAFGITEQELEYMKKQRTLSHTDAIQNDEGYVDVYHRAPLTGQDYAWRSEMQEKEQILTLEQVNQAIFNHLRHMPLQWVMGRSVQGS